MGTPHRDDPDLRPVLRVDVLERFLALNGAFMAARKGLERLADGTAPRLSSVALTGHPGDPQMIVEQVRLLERQLAGRLPWRAGVVAPVRLLVATLLLKHGDAPEAFVEEWERVRRLFRRLRVPRSGAHEILSMCVLRHCRGLTPIGDDAVERMRALHRALARKRRWVTGREHLPLAALLGGEEGAPENIAADIDGNFRALGTRLWRGRVLLTTSIVLRLAHLEPADATDRMREMTAALERARIMVLTDRYDEIALLCLLSLPAERVVERVVEIERRLAEMRTAPFWSQRFNLAASLAFLELMHGDPGAVALADIKTVLDMQELVDQAAAAGAV